MTQSGIYWKEIDLYSCSDDGFPSVIVDPGSPVVIILASGSEVRVFDPGRGRWIFSEHKNFECFTSKPNAQHFEIC